MNKLFMVMVLGFALVLAGCNTWNGFGKDLEKVGESVQKSSNK